MTFCRIAASFGSATLRMASAARLDFLRSAISSAQTWTQGGVENEQEAGHDRVVRLGGLVQRRASAVCSHVYVRTAVYQQLDQAGVHRPA